MGCSSMQDSQSQGWDLFLFENCHQCCRPVGTSVDGVDPSDPTVPRCRADPCVTACPERAAETLPHLRRGENWEGIWQETERASGFSPTGQDRVMNCQGRIWGHRGSLCRGSRSIRRHKSEKRKGVPWRENVHPVALDLAGGICGILLQWPWQGPPWKMRAALLACRT